jgi:hypothetical protein
MVAPKWSAKAEYLYRSTQTYFAGVIPGGAPTGHCDQQRAGRRQLPLLIPQHDPEKSCPALG